jgi:chromosome condensin MukBEF MukE localization factor
VLRTAAGELLSTDDITGRVIAAKGFDGGDAILRAAVREQVGCTVKRLRREGTIENVGAGRASKWKLATSA